MSRQRRLAVGLCERQRFKKDVPGQWLEFEGVDKSLGRHDLAKLAPERELAAIWRLLNESPGAAGTDIHRVDDRRIVAPSPPFRDQIRVRVRLEDEFARRVEDA